jgi:hypothetical protein
MAAALCDVCQTRPATVRVRIARDGQEQVLNLCDVDYARLRQSEERAESPFESLFGGGGIFDDSFGRLAGMADAGSAGEAAEPGSRRVPVRRRRADREAVDVADYFSEQTKELLQRAAQLAAEWGKREVDTEHLLCVLADNEVAQASTSTAASAGLPTFAVARPSSGSAARAASSVAARRSLVTRKAARSSVRAMPRSKRSTSASVGGRVAPRAGASSCRALFCLRPIAPARGAG